MKLNKDLNGILITDELHANVGTGILTLDHDTFFGEADFMIRTQANGNGTLLEPTDYALESSDPELSAEANRQVYTAVKILNPTYQTGQLYITYKTIGDYVEASDINEILNNTQIGATAIHPNMLGVWPHLALDLRYSNSQSTTSPVAAIACDGKYYYVCLRSNPTQILKCEFISYFSIRIVATLTLDYQLGENNCSSLLYVGNNTLVACFNTAPSVFSKIDTKTMTRIGAPLTLSADYNYAYAMTIYPFGPNGSFYIVACMNTSPGKVVMIDFNPFTLSSTLTLATGEDKPCAISYDGNFIYVACDVAPGKIVKIKPDILSKIATLSLGSTENYPKALCFDGRFLYAGLNMTPAKIVKINLSTFTTVGTALSLATGENACAALTFDGNDGLYAGCATSPTKVVKIDTNTFTRLSTLSFSSGAESNCSALTTDGKYIYIGMGNTPGYVHIRAIASYWG